MHIRVDEAGTFRIQEGAAKYFVMVALRVGDLRPLRKLFDQVKRTTLPKRLRQLPEIKASEASDEFRQRFYEGLAALDLEAHAIVINTAKVPYRLRDNEGALYAYLIQEVVSRCVSGDDREAYVVMDSRRLKGITRADFNAQLRARLLPILGDKARLEVFHQDSTTDVGLQAVDFLCWAIYASHQHGQARWRNLIASVIRSESRLFEGKEKSGTYLDTPTTSTPSQRGTSWNPR